MVERFSACEVFDCRQWIDARHQCRISAVEMIVPDERYALS
jgi:hypothetical protein